MKVTYKIAGSIVAIAIASVAATGIVSFYTGSATVESSAKTNLTQARSTRAAQLKDYLQGIREELQLVASNPNTAAAIKAFVTGWGRFDSPQERLQTTFIDDNPHEAGQRDKLVKPDSGTYYGFSHAKYHPWFRALKDRRGYYDIFLFDTSGNLVYSVFKESDFATNLENGEWADSGLGKVYQNAADLEPGNAHFEDFAPYGPSNGAPASFIATPVTNADGKEVGVLAFQMPIGQINAVMQARAGLSEAARTYIVGEDNLMRSAFADSDKDMILNHEMSGEGINAALNGETGLVESTGHTGEATLAAYEPLEFMGATWAIIAEEPQNSIFAPVRKLSRDMTLYGVLIALAAGVVGVGIARGVATPVKTLTRTTNRLAEQDWTVEVPYSRRRDELGELARAVQVLKDKGQEAERLEAEQKEQEKRQLQERQQMREQMAEEFEAQVGHVIKKIGQEAESMRSQAGSLSSVAEQTENQATNVASASEQASNNVQTVSSSTEELNSSIGEITRQVAQTNEISQTASSKVASTNEQIDSLNQAANQIGEVVKLIQDIAGQTNLLALNATIESARAGEAGKGFAVVANEVKNLASQTQDATERIRQQIESVQNQTQSAVTAVQEIGQVVDQVAEISQSVASAVEEQQSATQEISRSVQETADGTQQVSTNIQGVKDAVGQTRENAEEVETASQRLTEHGETLRQEVDKFLAQLREG